MLALLSLALPFHRGHSLQQQQANEVPAKKAPPNKSARLVQPSEQFDVGNLTRSLDDAFEKMDAAVSNMTDSLARELQAAIANASSCNNTYAVPNDCRCWMWSTPQTDACAAAEDTAWKGHQVGTWPPTAEEPGLPLFEMARWDGGLLQSYRCPAKCPSSSHDNYPCGASAAAAFAGRMTAPGGTSHTFAVAGKQLYVDGTQIDVPDFSVTAKQQLWKATDGCVLMRRPNPAANRAAAKMPGAYNVTFTCGDAVVTFWTTSEDRMPTGSLVNALLECPEDKKVVAGLCSDSAGSNAMPRRCADDDTASVWPAVLLSTLDGACSMKTPQCSKCKFNEPDRKAWLWGDPHVLTFNDEVYDAMGMGTHPFCEWSAEVDGGGVESAVVANRLDYYGCGVRCDEVALERQGRSWACGESSVVAVGATIFNVSVTVVHHDVYLQLAADASGVEVRERFVLDESEVKIVPCALCPGNQQLRISKRAVAQYISQNGAPTTLLTFEFGSGAPSCGDNVTLTVSVDEAERTVDRMPTKYMLSAQLRLSHAATQKAAGLCAPDVGGLLRVDETAMGENLAKLKAQVRAPLELGASAFATHAQMAVSALGSTCEVEKTDTKELPTRPHPADVCAEHGVDVQQAREACTNATRAVGGVAPAALIGQCMEDYCALQGSTSAAAGTAAVLGAAPFVCTSTPTTACGGDGFCFLDPTCSCLPADTATGDDVGFADRCGSAACAAAWGAKADASGTCGERIAWFERYGDAADAREACAIVANESPSCAACAPRLSCVPPADCGGGSSAGWPAGLGVCRPCFGGAASDPVPDSTMLRCSAVPAYLEKASGMVDDSVGRASAEARAKLALARK